MTYPDFATEKTNAALAALVESAERWFHKHFGYFKVGGITFVRVHRLQVSFCIRKRVAEGR